MEVTNLRVLRLRYQISLAELANMAGISNQHLSRIELGKVPMTAHHEEIVTRALRNLIAARKTALDGLEKEVNANQGQLLRGVGGSWDV